MRIGTRRKIAAWSLLVVISSMLLVSFFHVHHEAVSQTEECYQCAHHQPHSGHISNGTVSVHDCVLCQIISTPSVAASLFLLSILVFASKCLAVAEVEAPRQSRAGTIPTRGPPLSFPIVR